MGEAARAVGAGAELPFRGYRYKVAAWTLEMTGLFEARLEERAWDALERTRGTIPPAEYREREQGLMALIASGGLGYGSTAAAKFAASAPGIQYTTYLQLRAGNPDRPEVTEEFVAEMWKEQEQRIVATSDRMNAPADPPTAPAGARVSA